MRAPWWLSPWREVRRLRQLVFDANVSGMRLTNEKNALISEVTTLNERNYELARQLRIAAVPAAGTGSALVGWEQQGGVKPEFCLVGVDRGAAGGKRLYASRDLGGTSFGMTAMDDPPPRWRLATAMERMLTIDKPAYGECLAHLMTVWANWARSEHEQAGISGVRTPPEISS
jgi:hypothetical protein